MTRKHHYKRAISPLWPVMALGIGILAACNNPSTSNPTTGSSLAVEAKQAEAKSVLRQIYVMEQAYYQEKGFYWIDAGIACASNPKRFATIGITILPTARYTYYIAGNNDYFTATAVSSYLDDDVTQDIWTITDEGRLICNVNDAIH